MWAIASTENIAQWLEKYNNITRKSEESGKDGFLFEWEEKGR